MFCLCWFYILSLQPRTLRKWKRFVKKIKLCCEKCTPRRTFVFKFVDLIFTSCEKFIVKFIKVYRFRINGEVQTIESGQSSGWL